MSRDQDSLRLIAIRLIALGASGYAYAEARHTAALPRCVSSAQASSIQTDLLVPDNPRGRSRVRPAFAYRVDFCRRETVKPHPTPKSVQSILKTGRDQHRWRPRGA
jgi:hypothetical protein